MIEEETKERLISKGVSATLFPLTYSSRTKSSMRLDPAFPQAEARSRQTSLQYRR
jgi:hypothetical protein